MMVRRCIKEKTHATGQTSDPRKFYALTISLIIVFASAVSLSSASVIPENPGYSKDCYISPNFDLDIELNPDFPKSGGVLAKGQPLSVKIGGMQQAPAGIWLYKDGTGNPDKNVFVKIYPDENDENTAGGIILSDVRSHKLPSGRYFIYFVRGDSEIVKSGYFPDTNDEFEEQLNENRIENSYLKLVLIAEAPWIRCDQKTIPDTTSGTDVRLSGTTNLAAGTSLIVSAGPTATDDPYFKDQIIESTEVKAGDIYNTWQQTIKTTEMGPGEYMVTVEAADVDVCSVALFSIYDPVYAAENPEDDSLQVKSYKVDKDKKTLAEGYDNKYQQGMEQEIEDTDSPSSPRQSSPATAYLIAETALILGSAGYCLRRR